MALPAYSIIYIQQMAVPVFKIDNIQNIVQEPTFQLIILLTACSERRTRIDFKKPSVNIAEFSIRFKFKII